MYIYIYAYVYAYVFIYIYMNKCNTSHMRLSRVFEKTTLETMYSGSQKVGT